MIFHKSEKNYILILKKGEKLVESLINFAQAQNIKSAWVSGLGAVLNAEIGYYDLDKKEYESQKLDEVLEIANLNGNLALNNGELIAHLHIVLSGRDLNAYGGHLQEAIVGGTCELYIQPLTIELKRELDNETGLKLVS